jgi:hypothetical protein
MPSPRPVSLFPLPGRLHEKKKGKENLNYAFFGAYMSTYIFSSQTQYSIINTKKSQQLERVLASSAHIL